MNIGSNIKKFRNQRDITQEKLAEIINVSISAVSQWESNKTLPDISTIIMLANYFQVSTDELLGINSKRSEKIIANYCTEVNKLFQVHQYEEALKLMRKANTEYPGNDILRYNLAWALRGNIRTHYNYLDEAITIYQKILENSKDTLLRIKVERDLVYSYATKGDTESLKKALKYASNLPSFDACKEYNFGRANLLQENDLLQTVLNNIKVFSEALYETLEILSDEACMGANVYRDKSDMIKRITQIKDALHFNN